jgi:hypothetical protein
LFQLNAIEYIWYANGARAQDLQDESRAKNNGDNANGAIAPPNEQNLKEWLMEPHGELVYLVKEQINRLRTDQADVPS